jgi:hypothetical protein
MGGAQEAQGGQWSFLVPTAAALGSERMSGGASWSQGKALSTHMFLWLWGECSGVCGLCPLHWASGGLLSPNSLDGMLGGGDCSGA